MRKKKKEIDVGERIEMTKEGEGGGGDRHG